LSFFTLMLAALGLSMDAAAVSVANGLYYKHTRKSTVLLMAFYFGLFQAAMPLIGYFAGSLFHHAIMQIDHWIILIILVFLGSKMIFEALKNHSDISPTQKPSSLTQKDLLLQAVATSIDALAFGISLALIDVNIFVAVSAIGIITFLVCLVAYYVGQRFGIKFRKKAELFGGSILIIIGIRIFVQHMLG